MRKDSTKTQSNAYSREIAPIMSESLSMHVND